MSRKPVALPVLVTLAAVLSLGAVPSAIAQDAPAADATPAPSPGPGFSAGMSAVLGTQAIDGTNYETFGFIPDFGYGPLGVGIDLTFHFQFYQNPGGPFGIYPRSQDFWDNSLSTAQNIDKYLARIVYLRWGHKGDPLYAQLGLLPSTTLGSGFVVGGYDNGVLRPDLNYIGLEVDADGSLVGLPIGGFESFVGNISRFDVLGARLYAEPFGLATPDNDFLKKIQFGVTVAADTNPYAEAVDGVTGSGSVLVYGLDTLVPLYSNPLFSAIATADADVQGSNVGGEIGVGGKFLVLFQWGLQNRFLGQNFIPDYFDQAYEINRITKYQIYSGATTIPGSVGWQASLGTSLLEGQLAFNASLSGPWTPSSNYLTQPEFQALGTAKLKGFPVSLQGYYIKQGLNTASDLFSALNAQIGADVGYNIGAVTVTLVYDLHYVDPASGQTGTNGSPWVVTSSIQTTVKMF